MDTLHVLLQLAFDLVCPAAVGAKEGPLVRVGQLVFLHDSSGKAAVVAAFAAVKLQVLAVLPPKMKAAFLPRSKLFAALGTLVLVYTAVGHPVYLQVDRILK